MIIWDLSTGSIPDAGLISGCCCLPLKNRIAEMPK